VTSSSPSSTLFALPTAFSLAIMLDSYDIATASAARRPKNPAAAGLKVGGSCDQVQ